MCSGLFLKVKSSRNVSVRKLMPIGSLLPLQDERAALEARHAGHDLLAGAVLFLASASGRCAGICRRSEMTLVSHWPQTPPRQR